MSSIEEISSSFNNTTKQHETDDMDFDYFSELFANRPTKILAVVFSGIGGSLLICLIYGIIWFEHFGSDKKRTVINKLLASFCWACFEWFFAIQIPDMIRYIQGPLPSTVCLIQMNMKFFIYCQMLVYLDGIVLVRYLFIFKLKNPAAFQDDFWHVYINLTVNLFSFLIQFVFSQLPGRNSLYFYLCSGKDPSADLDIPAKSGCHLQALTALTIIIHVVVFVKIYCYNKKISPVPVTVIKRLNILSSLEIDSLSDITSCICSAISFSPAIVLTWKANQIPIQDFNLYPNYLYEYFMRMASPNLFGIALVYLHYHRNPKLRSTLKNELKNFWREIKVFN
jgi:hypothetical protein